MCTAGWLGLGTAFLLGRTRFGFGFALCLCWLSVWIGMIARTPRGRVATRWLLDESAASRLAPRR